MLGSFNKVTYNRVRLSENSRCKFCDRPDVYSIFTDDGEFMMSRLFMHVCEYHLEKGLKEGFYENNRDRKKHNMPELFEGLRIYLKRGRVVG